MKPHYLRFATAGCAALLLTAAYQRTDTSSVMLRSATAFLDSLTPEQKAKAVFKVDEDERLNFQFVPIVRKGLALREMQPHQQHLAQALLAAGLSATGYIKAVSIMSLEDQLRIIESDSGERRNPGKYYVSIFGEPRDKGAWGFRVEGHHMAQNFMVVNGKVASSPSFFGTNPAEIRTGPRTGLRVLANEEDFGRELIDSLDANQKKVAIVTTEAYKDILTTNKRKAMLDAKEPTGLSASKMNSKQFALLTKLVEEYASNVPDQLAQARMDQFRKAGKNIQFAWAGSTEKGKLHYYRVHAPAFLIEYDNTQNDGNHVHSVWRDYNGDFGLDLLAEHYKTSHR